MASPGASAVGTEHRYQNQTGTKQFFIYFPCKYVEHFWGHFKDRKKLEENVLQAQRSVMFKALTWGIMVIPTSEDLHQGRNNKVD